MSKNCPDELHWHLSKSDMDLIESMRLKGRSRTDGAPARKQEN